MSDLELLREVTWQNDLKSCELHAHSDRHLDARVTKTDLKPVTPPSIRPRDLEYRDEAHCVVSLNAVESHDLCEGSLLNSSLHCLRPSDTSYESSGAGGFKLESARRKDCHLVSKRLSDRQSEDQLVFERKSSDQLILGRYNHQLVVSDGCHNNRTASTGETSEKLKARRVHKCAKHRLKQARETEALKDEMQSLTEEVNHLTLLKQQSQDLIRQLESSLNNLTLQHLNQD